MKKIIIGIMGVMFITTPVFAQTVPTDTPTVQDQYIQALQTVIGLLQQEVAMLVEQLKSISDNQASIATQVQQIAQNNTSTPSQPVFGSVPETPTCVENPVVTLIASDTSIRSGERTSFTGSYSTGCPLNLNTKWEFKANPDTVNAENYGTLKNPGAVWNWWSLQGPNDNLTIYSNAYFYGSWGAGAGLSTTTIFTLTVGNVTATTTVVVQ